MGINLYKSGQPAFLGVGTRIQSRRPVEELPPVKAQYGFNGQNTYVTSGEGPSEVPLSSTWNASLSGSEGANQAPIPYDGVLYGGKGSGADEMFAIDLSDGSIIWQETVNLGGSPLSIPAIIKADDFSDPVMIMYTEFNTPTLEARLISDGSSAWTSSVLGTIGEPPHPPPLAFKQSVIIPDNDGFVHRIDANDGSSIWSIDRGVPVVGTGGGDPTCFATDGDYIYGGDTGGNMFRLDITDGSVDWSRGDFGRPNRVLLSSSKIIARSGGQVAGFLKSDGSLAGIGGSDTVKASANFVLWADNLVIYIANDETHDYLIAMDPTSATGFNEWDEVWRHEPQNGSLSRGFPQGPIASTTSKLIYWQMPQNENEEAYLVDPADGSAKTSSNTIQMQPNNLANTGWLADTERFDD